MTIMIESSPFRDFHSVDMVMSINHLTPEFRLKLNMQNTFRLLIINTNLLTVSTIRKPTFPNSNIVARVNKNKITNSNVKMK